MKTFSARAATLDQLVQHTIPQFICPVPHKQTLHIWFRGAGIPKFKTNPAAKRGGGPVFYSVAAVEEFLRTRRLTATTTPRFMGQVVN